MVGYVWLAIGSLQRTTQKQVHWLSSGGSISYPFLEKEGYKPL
jgi:hypothetical protein